MRYTKWLVVGVLLSAVMVSAGCRKAAPDPGQEAVKVRKPWIFGHGGVDRTPVKTGMSWVAPSTDIWYVVMQTPPPSKPSIPK